MRIECPRLALCLVAILALCPTGAGAQAPIAIFAGSGQQGYAGDEGPALNALLSFPAGLAVDVSGNVYVSDAGNACVRMVRPDGTVTTVAGTGKPGFSGDGGPAVQAQLAFPTGLAVDAEGNLYIADTDNQRIRKVARDGTISTVAGNGNQGFSGDGGPAVEAELVSPTGVAVDASGNLYIGDFGNSRVRVVSPSGVISTFAGSESVGYAGDGGPADRAALTSPYGVAVGADGSVYITDFSAHCVRKVDTFGIISTIAGTGVLGYLGDGGPAAEARLWNPAGIAVTADGVVCFADSGNNRARIVQPSGIIRTVIGSGAEEPFNPHAASPGAVNLSAPTAVAVYGRRLLITDDGHHCVWSVDLPPVVAHGDIDGDGSITVRDAMVALRIAVGLVLPTGEQRAVGDVAPKPGVGRVFGDGAVTVADAIRILRRAVGLEPEPWP
ncbi:MAG: NHL domain-containing protein [Armatimonadota bacterium]